VLGAVVAIEVFAWSANDVWSYQPTAKASGSFATDRCLMIFADGGMEFSYSSVTVPGLPVVHYPDEGHFHHESTPRSSLRIESECMKPTWVPAASAAGSFQRVGWGRGRFGFYTSHLNYLGRHQHHVAIAIPIWPVALLAAVGIVWSAYKRKRTRPPKPGYCPTCGYDLRATPNQCPECGTPTQLQMTSDK
jgi:hypothetical protein